MYLHMFLQQCTVEHIFNTVHILVNYTHNYVSVVSMRIITQLSNLST